MPSEKVKNILLHKTDLTEEQIEKYSEAECWKIIYSTPDPKVPKDPRTQVCFTGFGLSKKKDLQQAAIDNDMRVVGSVTNDLKYLVAGDNAGLKKLDKAEKKGAKVLTEEEFTKLLKEKE
ncbi:hypothetical protein OAF50_02670 [bacterium]|nr:hypothetical protein [bacterium]